MVFRALGFRDSRFRARVESFRLQGVEGKGVGLGFWSV